MTSNSNRARIQPCCRAWRKPRPRRLAQHSSQNIKLLPNIQCFSLHGHFFNTCSNTIHDANYDETECEYETSMFSPQKTVTIKINLNGLNYSEYTILFVIKLSLYFFTLFLNLPYKGRWIYLIHCILKKEKLRVRKVQFPKLMMRQKARSLDSWSRVFFILLCIMMVLSYKIITLYLSLIDSKSVKTEPFKSMNIFMYTKLSVHPKCASKVLFTV